MSDLSTNEELLNHFATLNPDLVYKQAEEHIDRAHSSNIVFVMSGDTSVPLFVKNWALPSLDIGELTGVGKRFDGTFSPHEWKLPGDKIEISDITLDLFCDERLLIWMKFFYIMQDYAIKRTKDYLQIGSLLFYTNTGRKCFLRILFHDLWFKSVSNMGGSASQPEDLSFSVTAVTSKIEPIENNDGI